MDRVKRIWYLSHMRAAKVQASLRIRAFSPEPLLLAHTSSESRGTFRQKARSLAPLNGLACAVKICRDGMLEDTNSLDGAHMTTHKMKAAKQSVAAEIEQRRDAIHYFNNIKPKAIAYTFMVVPYNTYSPHQTAGDNSQKRKHSLNRENVSILGY